MKNTILTINMVFFLTVMLIGCIDSSTDVASSTQPSDSTSNSDDSSTSGLPSEGNFLDSLVKRADLVFHGTLKEISNEMSIEQIPYTFVTYEVHEVIAGQYSDSTLTLKYVGGDFPDGRSLRASNAPEVKPGEQSILMVQKSQDTGCDFVDCEDGRFVIEDGQILAANKSAVVINDHGGVEYISSPARKSGEYKGLLDAMNVDKFIKHLKKLDAKSLNQGKGQRTTVTNTYRYEPFHAMKGLTQAGSAPPVPEAFTKSASDSQGSPYDQWEEEQLKQSGGNPVLSQIYPGDSQ